MPSRSLVTALILATQILTACALTAEQRALLPITKDPYENFNRRMFAITQFADKYAIRPMATIYRATTPSFLRQRLLHIGSNLGEIGNFTNNILQGKLKGATIVLTRVVVNSTLGLGGMFDPASQLGLTPQREDFGQTLAVWGVPAGPYVFVPFLGPNSPRSIAGFGADVVANPLTWVGGNSRILGSNTLGYARTGMGALNTLERIERARPGIEALERSSPDFYVSVRSLYRQRRAAVIQNKTASDIDDIPDISDLDDMEGVE